MIDMDAETEVQGQFEVQSMSEILNFVTHLVIDCLLLKSKAVPTRLPALGSELIPVPWQSAYR